MGLIRQALAITSTGKSWATARAGGCKLPGGDALGTDAENGSESIGSN